MTPSMFNQSKLSQSNEGPLQLPGIISEQTPSETEKRTENAASLGKPPLPTSNTEKSDENREKEGSFNTS